MISPYGPYGKRLQLSHMFPLNNTLSYGSYEEHTGRMPTPYVLHTTPSKSFKGHTTLWFHLLNFAQFHTASMPRIRPVWNSTQTLSQLHSPPYGLHTTHMKTHTGRPTQHGTSPFVAETHTARIPTHTGRMLSASLSSKFWVSSKLFSGFSYTKTGLYLTQTNMELTLNSWTWNKDQIPRIWSSEPESVATNTKINTLGFYHPDDYNKNLKFLRLDPHLCYLWYLKLGEDDHQEHLIINLKHLKPSTSRTPTACTQAWTTTLHSSRPPRITQWFL
jgi:hypothetical protein